MNHNSINLLLLEDVEHDAIIIMEYLRGEGLVCSVDWVSEKDQFLDKLKTGSYDIILSDYRLSGFSGLEALIHAKELQPDVPFICVSGTMGEEKAVELILMGAADYAYKDKLAKLPVSIRRALREVSEKTLRLEAENLLRHSEEENRKLLRATEQSPVSILMTDLAGNITYVNQAVLDLTGYSREELIGKNPNIFSSGETPKKDYESLWSNLISGREWRGEFSNKKKTGEIYWESALVSLICDENGLPVQYLAHKEDITEKKRVANELIEAKERAEKSDGLKTAFMSNISHEIRTPLHGILGFTEIILNTELKQDEKDTYLKMLSDASERLLGTITNYMDISLLASGNIKAKREPVRIKLILDKAYKKFLPGCTEKGLDLIVEEAEEMNHEFYGDQELLEKVVFHLVDNAVKFTDIGSISLRTRYASDSVTIFIKDTGPGIDEESRKGIFNEFMQTEANLSRGHEGSGLGIPIAKGFIELMGGRFRMESEVGKGSVFSFELKCERSQAVLNPESNSENMAFSNRKTRMPLTAEYNKADTALNY